MTEAQRRGMDELTGGHVHWNTPMDRWTTFHIGGPAEAVYEAPDIEELSRVLAFLHREAIPWGVLGAGSNLLVRDGGVPGVLIVLKGTLASIERSASNPFLVRAGAGLPIRALMRRSLADGFAGLEYLAGIPGTVGGAVAMNAGAFGNEIASSVVSVEILTAAGEVKIMQRADLQFHYRRTEFPAETVILEVCLRVEPSHPEAVRPRLQTFLARRKTGQPWGAASAGSVFKNPPGDFAGRLIEEVGLKGKRIGGAEISERHANFIVNTGTATAADVLALMALAREKVRARHGVLLEPEIQIVGEE